jgi:hypothetical protein
VIARKLLTRYMRVVRMGGITVPGGDPDQVMCGFTNGFAGKPEL